jgi:hypothetical protein
LRTRVEFSGPGTAKLTECNLGFITVWKEKG